MQHKVKVTVLRKELYKDLQKEYCADPNSGECPFYKVGDEFIFTRYKNEDTFWTMGKGKHCSEAWDSISRYIYSGLQGGSIMNGWMKKENEMIACCNDGTRPVIFKIERLDYLVVYFKNELNNDDIKEIKEIILSLNDVKDVIYVENNKFFEVYVPKTFNENTLKFKFIASNKYKLLNID